MLTIIQKWLRHYLTRDRAEIGMAVCGLFALVTPLLIWVSWSKEVFKVVLIIGFTSFLLATWFAQYAAPETVDPDQERLPKPGELPLTGSDEDKSDSWRELT